MTTQKFLLISMILMGIISGLLNLGCSKTSNGPDEKEEPGEYDIPGWKLVWQDEFNSPEIDLTKWGFEVNANGGGNNELQYYTDRPENAYIEDSALVIKAVRETFSGPEGTREYTSARMRTANKGDWKYGRFDIRAKLPFGQGLWPAIWMLPTDWVYGGWPASGEIDIMELLGHDANRVYGTIHYGGSPSQHVHTGGSYKLPAGFFFQEYHLFSLEWDSTEFRWSVDGHEYLKQNNWYTAGQPYPAPFDQEFHLLLNVAVGGNWPGNPEPSTIFPQFMYIDYVRVYERED